MSYILDALRRADAERERGAIPGLHTQNYPAGDDPPEARGLPSWVWVLIGLSILLLAAVVWLWLGGDSRSEVRVVQAPLPVTGTVISPPPAPPPASPPAPLAAPASPPPATTSAALSAPSGNEAPSPAPPPSPMATEKPTRPAPAASKPVATAAAASAAVHSAPAKPASPPAPAPVAELRAPPLSALPENLRRELPTLAVGGSVYAKTPSNRLLILNGQPFHEGDSPMSELVVEQIKLKSAVLSYKGQRFELSY